jgi:AMIN domain
LKLSQGSCLIIIVILTSWLVWQPQTCYSQGNSLVISQVGLSQTQGVTLLTMILNRSEQPKITPVLDRQAPELLIDFPNAKVANVPGSQAGDQQLVKKVRTAALPGGGGVRIIVELMPGKPYSYWRSGRAGARGAFQYIVGIKPDSAAGETYSTGSAATRGAGEAAPPPRTYTYERESTPRTEEERPSSGESSSYSGSSEYQRPTAGEMGEIARLMPAAAGPALGFLQQQGWSVQKDTSGRGGASQKFLLASSRYPNLSVKIEHIPTRAAGSPAIDVIAVSTDKLADSDADKYRQMIRWDMAKIKSHYEDIGDYYDDGLKPLRIRLRERSKAVALRDYEFFQKFLEAAVPQKPDLPEKIKKHLQDKANKRLEGAQYTESENPLVIMDMVDFYTLRVYYIGR